MANSPKHINGFLFKADGPIVSQIIKFDQGLNVFYGMNGVGKSTILKQIVYSTNSDIFSKSQNISNENFGVLFKIVDERAEDKVVLPIFQDPENSNTWINYFPRNISEIKLALMEFDQFFGFPVFVNNDAAFFPDWHWHKELPLVINDIEQIISEMLRSGYVLAKPTLNRLANFEVIPVHPRFIQSLPIENLWNEIVSKLNSLSNFYDDYPKKNNKKYLDFLTACQMLSRNILFNKNNFNIQGEEPVIDSLPLSESEEIYLPSIGYARHLDYNILFENHIWKYSKNVSDVISGTEEVNEINSLTLDHLSRRFPMEQNLRKKNLESNLMEVNEIWQNWKIEAIAISEVATKIYKKMLFGAPKLEFKILDFSELTSRTKNFWYFELPPKTLVSEKGDEKVKLEITEISKLSSAQLRWALISIKIAIYVEQIKAAGNLTVVIDEPETALHRNAENYLAQGLRQVSEEFGIQFIIATHSPAFLEIGSAKIFEVKNIKGFSYTNEIPNIVRENLDELGLHPSDLLRSIRKVLLVEGEHEVVILNTLFKDELAESRVMVIPIRGARELKSVIESTFIFEFTDAEVCVLIDNTDSEQVNNIWNWALALADQGEKEAAKKYIIDSLPTTSNKIENKFLKELYIRSIDKGLSHRINVLGMSKEDIIEYLDPSYFIPGESWENLKFKWAESGKKTNFKTWLTLTYGLTFNVPTLEGALKKMKPNHADFKKLLNYLKN